jgi:hypothetical protein
MSDEINPSPSRPSIKLEHDMADGHSLSPSGSAIKSEHDMSDEYNSSGGDDSSDDGAPVSKTQKSAKKHKPTKNSKSQKKAKLEAARKQNNRMHVVHRFLGKEICTRHKRLSELSKHHLTRIADDARYRYRSSAKKRLQHLKIAAKTLKPAALTRYVRLFRADNEMQRLIRRLEPEEEPVKEKPSQALVFRFSLPIGVNYSRIVEVKQLTARVYSEGSRQEAWSMLQVRVRHRISS